MNFIRIHVHLHDGELGTLGGGMGGLGWHGLSGVGGPRVEGFC